MAAAIQRAIQPALTPEVSEWVLRVEHERAIAKPQAGSSLATAAVSGAGETEILAVRPRRARKISMMFAAAGLAVGGAAVAIAMHASHPTPNAVLGATDVTAGLSGASDAPLPSSASSSAPAAAQLQVAPTSGPLTTPFPSPSPRMPNGPPKHVAAPPRPSAVSSAPRAQSAKILSVLDTRQ